MNREPPPEGAGRGRDPLPITALAVAALPSFVLVDFALASARGWSLENHFDRTFIGESPTSTAAAQLR